jgi:hypothetical protein
MSIINIQDYIVSLDKIVNKNINNVTFKEIISLVFHAVQIVSHNETEPDYFVWKEIYVQFEEELKEQNKKKWPYMTITKNDYGKRIDIFSTDTSFISSNNIFMLLLRLLYIEKYKRPYVYRSYKYHKILGYKMETTNDTCVIDISFKELFDFLLIFMKHYIKIYNDGKYLEFNLGKEIIDQLI